MKKINWAKVNSGMQTANTAVQLGLGIASIVGGVISIATFLKAEKETKKKKKKISKKKKELEEE